VLYEELCEHKPVQNTTHKTFSAFLPKMNSKQANYMHHGASREVNIATASQQI
jgi:hypothetical protein